MKLTNLRIGIRLALGFGLVLALLLAIVSISYLRLVHTGGELDALMAMEKRSQLADQWLNKTQLNISRIIAIAKAAGQPEIENYFTPQIKATSAEITEIQAQLEASAGGEASKALMANIAEKRSAYLANRAQPHE